MDGARDEGHPGDPAPSPGGDGLDTPTLLLAAYFVALILIVAALLLLPAILGPAGSASA